MVLTLFILAAYADESICKYQKATHLIHSGAHPNNARIQSATHHFELHVVGNALSQLFIELPEGISISQGIEVTDQLDKKVDATFSINDKKATIAFAEPVFPGTIPSIDMKGIRVSDLQGHAWLYQVYGSNVRLTTEIPLRTVGIQTYK